MTTSTSGATSTSGGDTTRRAVLGTGALGAAAALAACGSGSDETTAGGGARTADSPAASGAGGATTPAPGATTQTGSAGGGQGIDVAGVEVGGGVVDTASTTVVTRPSESEWKAFDATCTHEGCLVAEVVGGRIHCPCHNSYFDVSSGEPVEGPAQEPLGSKTVSVSGDTANVS